MSLSHQQEASVAVPAQMAPLFDYLDDQARLGRHMQKSSMMMMGGHMDYEFDAARGRAIGSVITLRGRILGLKLFVEEIITERQRPTRKVWATRGLPRILVLGAYRMGFEIVPSGEHSKLRVFIDYDLPSPPVWHLLGLIFAPIYARWCVTQMTTDADGHFAETNSSASTRS